jgi:membrane fusion protein (multidrug efflux system)
MSIPAKKAHTPETTRFNVTIIVAAAVLVLAGAFGYWVYASQRESTDDAQIDGHIHPINARIGGTVTWVNPAVDDTRIVSPGTELARLDPNDYSPVVERLTGEVGSQQANLKSAELNVPVTTATVLSRLKEAQAAVAEADAQLNAALGAERASAAAVAQIEANYHRAEEDRKRYEPLVAQHEISRSEYEQRATEASASLHQLESAQAAHEAAQHSVKAAQERRQERRAALQATEPVNEMIATARERVQAAHGDLKRSQASLLDATQNLGYTSIVAPVGGLVGRRSIEVGQRVQPGQLLLNIAPLDDLWVTANFKETQLRHMHIGQEARIHVDAYNRTYSGSVASIGGATGSRYSVLPPENATGNYVRIVQRIPVRIQIERGGQNEPLLPGMSVEVTVVTKR